MSYAETIDSLHTANFFGLNMKMLRPTHKGKTHKQIYSIKR